MNREPYKTCTNINCIECLKNAAYDVSFTECEVCSRPLGYISDRLVAIIEKLNRSMEVIGRLRTDEWEYFRDASPPQVSKRKQLSIIEELEKATVVLDDDLNSLNHSVSFQAWKDGRKG